MSKLDLETIASYIVEFYNNPKLLSFTLPLNSKGKGPMQELSSYQYQINKNLNYIQGFESLELVLKKACLFKFKQHDSNKDIFETKEVMNTLTQKIKNMKHNNESIESINEHQKIYDKLNEQIKNTKEQVSYNNIAKRALLILSKRDNDSNNPHPQAEKLYYLIKNKLAPNIITDTSKRTNNITNNSWRDKKTNYQKSDNSQRKDTNKTKFKSSRYEQTKPEVSHDGWTTIKTSKYKRADSNNSNNFNNTRHEKKETIKIDNSYKSLDDITNTRPNLSSTEFPELNCIKSIDEDETKSEHDNKHQGVWSNILPKEIHEQIQVKKIEKKDTEEEDDDIIYNDSDYDYQSELDKIYNTDRSSFSSYDSYYDNDSDEDDYIHDYNDIPYSERRYDFNRSISRLFF